MRRGYAAAGGAGRGAGAVRLARYRAADLGPQISQFQGRAAVATQCRRVEMERPQELQMDHSRLAALPDRSPDPRRALSPKPKSAFSTERRFRPGLPWPLQEGAGVAGGKAKVIMEQTYDLSDPTIDSQLINLSKSGADVFYNISTGKASSQSIRKIPRHPDHDEVRAEVGIFR